MLSSFADWLAATAVSSYFRDALWVIPVSQSIHICCISIVFGSGAMISLRLLGAGRSGRSISQLVSTVVPWMYRALIVLLLTGAVQTIAEPRRQFSAEAFWLKMCMVATVTAMTVVFARAVRRHAVQWDAASSRTAAGRMFAVVSLALWVAIIVCGRFIAYTYTDFRA